MNNKWKVALLVLTLPFVIRLASAGTNYVGQVLQDVNVKAMNGTTTDTGIGASTVGTQRVVLASDQPTIPIAFTGASTGTVNLGQVGGSAITLGQKAMTASIPVVLPSDQVISATISGPVTVTPGTGTWSTTGSTVSVQNVAGTSLDSNLKTVNGTSISLGATTKSASLPVVLPTDMAALITISTAVGTPQQMNVGATSVSATLVPANANRVGVECDSDCSNNKNVYLGFGAAAANTGKILAPCSSWTPPSGMRFTSSITVLAESGTQVIRCIEY